MVFKLRNLSYNDDRMKLKLFKDLNLFNRITSANRSINCIGKIGKECIVYIYRNYNIHNDTNFVKV